MTVLTGKTWLHSDFEYFPVNLGGGGIFIKGNSTKSL